MLIRLFSAAATLVVALLLLASPAAATWSIVAVDAETGEVGVAVASCVPASALGATDRPLPIIALAPGEGAGIAQALPNLDAVPEIVELLGQSSSPESVIAAVTAAEFDPEAANRQFGVASLTAPSAAYTGESNFDVAYDRQIEAATAQGNILVSQAVINDALIAFDRDPQATLAARLVAALEAGSAAGGDSRCGDQTALFAHVVVAAPGDAPTAPSLMLLTTAEEGSGENPVDALVIEFREGGAPEVDISVDTSTMPVWIIAAGVAAIAIGGGALLLLRRAG